MVNDLTQLLRDSSEHAPPDDHELGAVLRAGRRRVRVRRAGLVGATALVAGAVGLGSLWWLNPQPPDLAAAGVPKPAGPVLHLADARQGVAGADFRVLTSYTNEDLDKDNGQYLDGVTDDGLVLFRDGPRTELRHPRYALLDHVTGEKDWLPARAISPSQPLELGEDRLVFLGLAGGGQRVTPVAHVFDREDRQWRTVRWPDLPKVDGPTAVMGPDDRLYVRVPTSQDDETFRVWSASLTDPGDVQDEGLTVGELIFTDDSMVWTDATNGDSGQVHVRDLASGEERSFDPGAGERCNLLTLGATDDHVVLGQFCGTYADGVRDDRVQVLTTGGEQVVTVQDSGLDGALDSGSAVVTVTSYQRGQIGTYVYDLASERFLRLSDDLSQWHAEVGRPAGVDQVWWSTSANRGDGATQHLGELLP